MTEETYVEVLSKNYTKRESDGKFNVSLPTELHNYRYVNLQSVTFPNAIYNINSNNNVLYWNDNATTALTSTIPVGQYDISNLITEINYQMSVAVGKDANTYTIELVANTSTALTVSNKLKFVASTGNIALRAGDNSILNTLGFLEKAYGAATSQTAPNTYNLSVTKVYLEHNLPTINNLYKGAEFQDYFIIQLDNYGMVSRNADLRQMMKSLSKTNISSIDLNLVDENAKPVTNNGVPWSVLFKFVK